MKRIRQYLDRRWRKLRLSGGSNAAGSEALLENVERYLAVEIPAVLGASTTTGILEEFQTGRRTLTLAWEHSAFGPLVVRAWKADEKGCPARHCATASKIVGAAGIPVAEIVHTDDSAATRCEYGIEIGIERRAPGRTMVRRKAVSDDGVLRLIGSQLARLHAQTNDAWGRPWMARNPMKNPKAHYLERLQRYSADIGTGLRTIGAEDFRAIVETTRRQIERFDFATPRLCHGDFFAANLIQSDDGGVTWIDFETVHYGLAGMDLVSAQRWLGPLRQFETFREAYEAERGVSLADSEEERVLSARLSMLHKLASRVRRLERYETDHPRIETFRREQIEYEQCLRDLQEAESPDVLSAVVRELLT